MTQVWQKDCRAAVRGVDDYNEGEAISWACMIDSEFSGRSVLGESEPIPDKSMAEQKTEMTHLGEMTLEELENAILEIKRRDNPS